MINIDIEIEELEPIVAKHSEAGYVDSVITLSF